MSAEMIGSVGVGLILLAFLLNLIKVWSVWTWQYLTLNLVGAIMACYYAWVGSQVPFVILEAVWAAAAGLKLLTTADGRGRSQPAE